VITAFVTVLRTVRTTLLLLSTLFFAATMALADDPSAPIPGLPTPISSPSPDPFAPEEMARRIAATRHLAVPMPTKTPFDADRTARRVYLKAYRDAYRHAAAGYLSTMCPAANTPYLKALEAGHSDGELAAVKNGLWIHPTISKPTPK
jgi:hypothetical protein